MLIVYAKDKIYSALKAMRCYTFSSSVNVGKVLMSKRKEFDKDSNQPEATVRPEMALFKVAWDVVSTNLEDWRTSRSVAVNLSKTALSLRGPDLATIEAYDT